LLVAGQYAKAEAVYRRDLEVFRETGWALHGLAQALKKQGKDKASKAIRARFEKAWAHADTKLEGSKAI
jgi:hypothetical protein